MDISVYIKRVARGKHGSEHLTLAEARSVFTALLAPDVDELQLGAWLIAQRMKGETGAELAGFVEAARSRIACFGQFKAGQGAVDLPCYAGKRRAPHAFLAAAMQARDAGIPVVVHGIECMDGRVSAWQILQPAGVNRAATLSDAARILGDERMVYVDLADICPDLFRIFQLRARLGVRSFASTVARLLNPLCCDGQLNGFFHTPYADCMTAANCTLGQPRSLIFMGAEGEPELYADRQKLMITQQGDALSRHTYRPAGLAAYPRQRMDLLLLQTQFAAMLEGAVSEREAAVIARMGEALRWASTAELPATWSTEE